MTKRDPRVEPKPGDKLRKGKSVVDVCLADEHGFGYSFVGTGKDMPPMPEWDKPWRPAWQKWAKNAEVIHAAE